MNEEELQIEVPALLRKIFPTFQNLKIESERSFSIKFGHKNVTIDGKEAGDHAKQGIFDLLIKINDKPTIILELKAPGHQITEEDVKQGISYARLTDPICPITVISNGVNSQVYNTITKKRLTDGELELDVVSKFEQALTVAAEDAIQSFKILLEKDYSILKHVLSGINITEKNELTGEYNHWQKPIISDFHIKRESLNNFVREIKEHPFIMLHGDALIGKTNFIFQYLEEEEKAGNSSIYITSTVANYSVFSRLSNYLTSYLSVPVTDDEIKRWLLVFKRNSTPVLTVIYDHLRSDASDSIKAEIIELTEIFANTKNRIVLSVDTTNIHDLRKEIGRNIQNKIGLRFKPFKLSGFNENEYYQAQELLFEKCGAEMLPGGVLVPEYRIPRIWRLLIGKIEDARTHPRAQALLMPIPSVETLQYFKEDRLIDFELKRECLKLTKIYVDCASDVRKTPDLALMGLTIGCIPEKYVNDILPADSLKILVSHGFLERRPYKDLSYIYVPKLPELLAGLAPTYIAEKYLPKFRRDLEKTYKAFFSDCEHLLYGELIACAAIMEIGSKDVQVFSNIMTKLKDERPTKTVSTGAMTVAVFVDPVPIHIQFEEGVESVMIDNMFPSLVLAHLTAMLFVSDTEDPQQARFEILEDIADSNFVIRRADRGFIHEGISTLELPHVGTIVPSTQIVEPIVQSLLLNLLEFPDEFGRFFVKVAKAKEYKALHRIYSAAKFAKYFQQPEVTKISEFIVKYYEDKVPAIFAQALAANKGRRERRLIEKQLRKKKK